MPVPLLSSPMGEPDLTCHQDSATDPTLGPRCCLNPHVLRTPELAPTAHPTPRPGCSGTGPAFIGLGKPPSFKMGVYLSCSSDFNLRLYHGHAVKQCSGLLILYASESLKLLVRVCGNKCSRNELQALLYGASFIPE